jgi:hypothetical protein
MTRSLPPLLGAFVGLVALGSAAPHAAAEPGLPGGESQPPLWSICGPRSAPTERDFAVRESLPPVLHDCAQIGGPEPMLQASEALQGVAMSLPEDAEEEEPICSGSAQCSPVPAGHTAVVVSITAVKATVVPPVEASRPGFNLTRPPYRLGAAAAGYPRPPFEPPR